MSSKRSRDVESAALTKDNSSAYIKSIKKRRVGGEDGDQIEPDNGQNRLSNNTGSRTLAVTSAQGDLTDKYFRGNAGNTNCTDGDVEEAFV